MKFLKSMALAGVVALTFVACKKDEAGEAAQKLCDCSKPMVLLNSKMEAIKDKPEELAKLAGEMSKAGATFEACARELDTKYADKKSDKVFEEAVKKAMEAKCPDVVKAMNQSAPSPSEMPAPAPAAPAPAPAKK